MNLQRLCAFIERTTQLDIRSQPGPQLATLVQSIFEVESVAIYDADLHKVYRAGEWFDDLEGLLRNICTFQTSSDDPETGLTRRVLSRGDLPIGAMLLRGETRSLLADTVASLIATTFDRYHAFANESRTESARQTEQLRTAVLDSLAHSYKTPLTVIEAASSGLAEMAGLAPAQAGLLALIEEQTQLLSHLTTRLLKTARLEGVDLVPRAEAVAIAPLLDDLLASLRDRLASVAVRTEISPENLSISCDRGLLATLLTQYIDNAAKYADHRSPVTIAAIAQANEVVFSVHNFGPVIPSSDVERVFDRYFRCTPRTNKAPGTGIGLSVAKRTTMAQGGHVWVTSDARKGTTFYASLPSAMSSGATG